jgi:asparagine synthetase A
MVADWPWLSNLGGETAALLARLEKKGEVVQAVAAWKRQVIKSLKGKDQKGLMICSMEKNKK